LELNRLSDIYLNGVNIDMEYHTQQKAMYQLCNFINSEKRYQLKITSYEISILFVLCRYLDMPKKTCCLKQIPFSIEAGMSERQFRYSCEKLVILKLMFRYMKGKLYYYELGETITEIEN
jgi:hypothetical protein